MLKESTSGHSPSHRIAFIALAAISVLAWPLASLGQVTLIGNWTGETSFESNGFNYAPPSGCNRIVVVMVSAESTTDPVADVNQVRLGGQLLTAIQNANGIVVGSAGTFHDVLWLGYLLESGISSMSGDALSVTWDQAPNTPDGEIKVMAATYHFVDQSTPMAASAANSNVSAATLQAGSVAVGSGDRLIYVTSIGTPANHTAPSGYTEQIELDGPTNDMSAASAQRDATTAATVNPTATWDNTQRVSMISAVLNNSSIAALAVSDHVAGQVPDFFVGDGAAASLDLFAFQLANFNGNQTVTQLVFSLTGVTGLSSGDFSSVQIVVDSNNDGMISGGESTTVGGAGVVNVGAGTITFSTSFTVTAATNYILRATLPELRGCDTVTIGLSPGNISTAGCEYGSVTPGAHSELEVTGSLLAHWRLDDGGGLSAADSAGGVAGSLQNMEVGDWVAGQRCGGLDFDGANEYVQTQSDAMKTAGGFTVSLWFKKDAAAGVHHMVWQGVDTENGWGAGSTDPANHEFHLTAGRYDSDNALVLFYGSGETGTQVEIQTAFSDTTNWHHLAATVANAGGPTATAELFLDGVSQGTDTGTQTDRSRWNTNIRLGRPGADTRYFDGQLDDVRVYGRVLTSAEIQALGALYDVVDLGSHTGEPSLALGVNNARQIAGYDEAAADGDPTGWRSGTCAFTGVGTLPDGTVAEVRGINSAGTVVGWSETTDGRRHAFRWTSGGGMVDLGVLAGRTDSEALDINASGEIAGTSLDFSTFPNDWRAFLYLPGAAYGFSSGMNALGALSGGAKSVAMGINASGEVVGGAENASGNFRPFIYVHAAKYGLGSAGMHDLGTLGGESELVTHRAEAINDSGVVVGVSYTAGGDRHAFSWVSGVMTDLGSLAGNSSWAFDVNSSGDIVGMSLVSLGNPHAFLYTGGTMIDLNTLVDSNLGWVLQSASGINDYGDIVGWGTNPNGDTRAFMLTQLCNSTSLRIDSGEPPLRDSGRTDDDGTVEISISDDAHQVLAELLVTDAEPDETFELTVIESGPGGPGLGTAGGFAEGVAVARTVSVSTTALPGSYRATLRMALTAQELIDLGVTAKDLELHALDSSQGTWYAAGHNLGQMEPDGTVGQSGFTLYDDGSVDYWATLDEMGEYTVGQAPGEPEPQQDAIPKSGGSRPTGGLCGVAAIYWLTVACLGLFMGRACRQAKRLVTW